MDYGLWVTADYWVLDYLLIVNSNIEDWGRRRWEWNIMMISKNEAEDNEMNTEFEIIDSDVPTLSS